MRRSINMSDNSAMTRRDFSKLITLGVSLGIAIYAIPYIARNKDCCCYEDYAEVLRDYAGVKKGKT